MDLEETLEYQGKKVTVIVESFVEGPHRIRDFVRVIDSQIDYLYIIVHLPNNK